MQVERTRAQLLGLNAPTELHHSGDEEHPLAFRDLSHFSDADLAEAARLAATTRKGGTAVKTAATLAWSEADVRPRAGHPPPRGLRQAGLAADRARHPLPAQLAHRADLRVLRGGQRRRDQPPHHQHAAALHEVDRRQRAAGRSGSGSLIPSCATCSAATRPACRSSTRSTAAVCLSRSGTARFWPQVIADLPTKTRRASTKTPPAG